MGEALNAAEHTALDLASGLADAMREVIGTGPEAGADFREAVAHIHALQQMIMSQAAARAYPDTYRLLGQDG